MQISLSNYSRILKRSRWLADAVHPCAYSASFRRAHGPAATQAIQYAAGKKTV